MPSDLTELLNRLLSASSCLAGAAFETPPDPRPGETLDDFLARHEEFHREAAEEVLLDWLTRGDIALPPKESPLAFWLKAHFDHAAWLALAMSVPLDEWEGYLPTTAEGELDPGWPFWLLFEAWRGAGRELWLQRLVERFAPPPKLPQQFDPASN